MIMEVGCIAICLLRVNDQACIAGCERYLAIDGRIDRTRRNSKGFKTLMGVFAGKTEGSGNNAYASLNDGRLLGASTIMLASMV